MTSRAPFRSCRTAKVKPGATPLGCTRAYLTLPRKCTIWLLTDEDAKRLGWDINILLRHEIGHCNGWHHPD